MAHPVMPARAALLAFLLGSAIAACGGGSPPPAPPGLPQNPPMKDATQAMFDEEPDAPAAPAAAPGAATPAGASPPAAPQPVTVKIEARSGSKVAGQAVLTETATGVRVNVTLENGGAPGPHGAHFHEKGDCSAPDAKSAGDHFNPEKHEHALPGGKPTRHLGDMGNIEIGKDGKGTLSLEIPGANLKAGDAKSLRGRAIIIHEKKDDGGQPTGNAGGRTGCGVVPS